LRANQAKQKEDDGKDSDIEEAQKDEL